MSAAAARRTTKRAAPTRRRLTVVKASDPKPKPKSLVKVLHEVRDEFLDCMDPSIGHQWQKIEDWHVIPAFTEGRRLTHVARKFLCPSCTKVKIERCLVVRRGGQEILERIGVPEYSRVEGYQIPGIPRGLKPSQVIRAEQYRRALGRAVGAAKGDRLHDR